ncbi:MAG: DUF5597 domain-containing protein [Clostridia bacterium]|nr:DUF5597 domain-containing protein [Clostridia bacterium]
MKSEIRLQNGKQVLYVDGAPFFAVAGEVHNSDSSSPEYMNRIWQIADDLGLNTLLLPVTWELTEPEEGVFDFSIPDALMLQAREWNKKIIFLWFGSWKNAQMMYAPEWVKRDILRFRRAQVRKGETKSYHEMGFMQMPYYTISYLCDEACTADAKAFAALMAHIREVDEATGTVIGVQVENETGLAGSAREHSDEADAAFAAEVPAEFVAWMRSHTDTMHPDVREAVGNGSDHGNWTEVFGPVAEEVFSAYYVSAFVGAVARKGREVYDLPMFANAWLAHKGEAPGQYPSGGPVSRMHEVWRYCAPEIDVLCPDIYVPEFLDVCDDYARNQALFIPEAAVHAYAAPRLAYCIGHYHAMGYSPFGFDDIGHPFTMMQGFLFGMDVNDPALKTPQNFDEYAWFAKMLCSMMPILADKYGTAALQAVSAEQKADAVSMDFGKLCVKAVFKSPRLSLKGNGVALCVQVGAEDYYLLAYQCDLALMAGDARHMDILAMEEGRFVNGAWQRDRRLNGDEVAMLTIETPRLFRLRIHTYNDYC